MAAAVRRSGWQFLTDNILDVSQSLTPCLLKTTQKPLPWRWAVLENSAVDGMRNMLRKEDQR